MFRRLFAIETAAIQSAVEQASGRYDNLMPSPVDSFRDPARPMAMPAYYGMVSARVAS